VVPGGDDTDPKRGKGVKSLRKVSGGGNAEKGGGHTKGGGRNETNSGKGHALTALGHGGQ